MDRIYESGASATPPSAPAAPSSGYPTKGSALSAIAATKPGEYWFYMVTESLRRVIVDAGLTPDHTDLGLLSDAIHAIAAPSLIRVPVRQTVINSAVDSNGLPNYISAGTGLAVNIAATATDLVLTAAGGSNASGQVDRCGVVDADTSITGLSASTTNYLYADIAADGTVTFGSTTLAPVYQQGGSRSSVNGQFTFNVQEMTATVGNGSSAVAAYRVFIGEAVTGVSSVTGVVNYALCGRFREQTTITTNTTYTFNSNIGVYPQQVRGLYRESNAYGWATVSSGISTDAGVVRGIEVGQTDRNTCKAQTGNSAVAPAKATFAHSSAPSGGDLLIVAERGW